MHCLWWNKSVSNRIPCASLLFSWTSQPQLGLDGSWVSHLYFSDWWKHHKCVKSDVSKIQPNTDYWKIHKCGKCDIFWISVNQEKMKRWLAEISWRWYFWICPNNSKGQEEEHSCNRDHPNWYLRHIIDSINIISTSQMLEAPATTAPTADGIGSLPGSRPTWQAEQKICWNYSINIITTSQRSDQLVTPKHHQRQYQPASSNHYNSNPTHKNVNNRNKGHPIPLPF